MDDNNRSVRKFNRTLLVYKSFYFAVYGARWVCNKKKVFISQAALPNCLMAIIIIERKC